MEEKNLTDDEIVTAYEHCIVNGLGCRDCILWDWKKNCVSEKDVLNLIHRLRDKIAEYERQLADGELVSKDWHDEQVLHLQEENAELQKQEVNNGEKENSTN